jgi:hypothetical protein
MRVTRQPELPRTVGLTRSTVRTHSLLGTGPRSRALSPPFSPGGKFWCCPARSRCQIASIWILGNGLQTVCRNARRGFRGRNWAADASRCAGRAWVWLGGRDLNPDNVVQRRKS